MQEIYAHMQELLNEEIKENRHYLSQITEKQNYKIVAYLTFLNN